ncbi:MAG: PorT family protein [Ekhidna sp.]|nr:PorT family protein [Ekhidna sp.]
MLSILQVNAQAVFGVKAGSNIANASFSETVDEKLEGVDTETRLSAHAGLVLQLPLNEEGKSMIQFEALYSSVGAERSTVEVSSSGSSTSTTTENLIYRIGQIQLPILYKIVIGPGIFLNAGPYIAANVSARVEEDYKVEPDEFNDSGKNDYGVLSDYKDFDFGLAAGLGYQFKSGFFIEGRYNLGLADIFDSIGDDKSEWKNQVIQAGVGFIFNK